MSEIVNVKLSSIGPNPMRNVRKYPFNETKIAALMRSVADVGCWPRMIARKKSGEYQLAFGHHLHRACEKQLGKEARVPVIVDDLNDEQMLQYMGRENMEDYNADFLVMLNSWEAAEGFLTDSSRDRAKNPQPVEIARLLGWIRFDDKGKSETRMSDTAQACSNAAKLIKGGHLTQDQLRDLPVSAVRDLTGRIVSQHEMVEKMAKVTNRPTREVEQVKTAYAKAGKLVANSLRRGTVASRDIRGEVDREVIRTTRMEKPSPLFVKFGSMLADQIAKVCRDDMILTKFEEIKRSLNNIELAEDVQVVKRIGMECGHASERFQRWQKTFSDPRTKVVKLKEISRG